MQTIKYILTRDSIKKCIENNDSETATQRLMELFFDTERHLLSYHRFLQENLNLELNEIWVNEYLKQ